MIAQRQLETQPRISNPRSARTASHTRRKKSAKKRYAHLAQFIGVLGLVVVMLMTYVMLMSNLTSLNYAVARAQRERISLQDQTARLDDRIATLRSQERLAAIANKLGMRDAQQYAIVALPQPHAVHHENVALLSALGGWFGQAR